MTRRSILAFPTLSLGAFVAPTGLRSEFGPAGDRVAHLSSARAAVFHAIEHLGIQKALVPSYHCGVEIEAILRAGSQIEYYPVRRDMTAAIENIVARGESGTRALFVVHYWGFPQDLGAAKRACQENGLLLIEDCAHALFSEVDGKPLGTSGDASVYSLPKSLPVPDGGILLSKDLTPRATTLEAPSPFIVTKAAARSLLEHTRSSRRAPVAGMAAAALSLKRQVARDENEGLGDYGDTPLTRYGQRMSSLTRHVFRRSSGTRIRERRRINFRHLCDRLEGLSGLSLQHHHLEEGVSPLFCPVIVEDRNGLEAHLRRNRIETFVFGRSLHPTLDADAHADARFLSRHVLGLPIHQDLREDDMDAIAEETRTWLAR